MLGDGAQAGRSITTLQGGKTQDAPQPLLACLELGPREALGKSACVHL